MANIMRRNRAAGLMCRSVLDAFIRTAYSCGWFVDIQSADKTDWTPA